MLITYVRNIGNWIQGNKMYTRPHLPWLTLASQYLSHFSQNYFRNRQSRQIIFTLQDLINRFLTLTFSFSAASTLFFLLCRFFHKCLTPIPKCLYLVNSYGYFKTQPKHGFHSRISGCILGAIAELNKSPLTVLHSVLTSPPNSKTSVISSQNPLPYSPPHPSSQNNLRVSCQSLVLPSL